MRQGKAIFPLFMCLRVRVCVFGVWAAYQDITTSGCAVCTRTNVRLKIIHLIFYSIKQFMYNDSVRAVRGANIQNSQLIMFWFVVLFIMHCTSSVLPTFVYTKKETKKNKKNTHTHTLRPRIVEQFDLWNKFWKNVVREAHIYLHRYK